MSFGDGKLKVRHTFVPQKGPQVAFLQSPCDITIYGGSRGGGKTYAVLGEFWIHAETYGSEALGLIVRKFREAADAGDKDTALEASRVASRKLDKAVSKGVIHKNQAANRKSAMAKRINSAA